jgi:hypothetical protein
LEIFNIKNYEAVRKVAKIKAYFYQHYSNLKRLLDTVQETLMNVMKKQMKNNEIGRLSEAINYDFIRSALKNKLIKRVNANPKMIDNVYTII